ncbi:lytic transglycosylase domain-containing protein [Brevibacillus laterosporus]|uniref:Lytic transglycosylase domain-containing protein n=1 Tax=Brevibacillus laterosporus TaxID=1465 RepID=A0A518VAE9_BRELA|nr:transglycosylase SLT domain-containing protein [Brevibacillus laterosporus]QDX93972.1 lytic transglycosylase domain-containing protein [Brevibacillus laterosporus]TPG67919.1 lytic transglycosylase domain-containing protein [Brevibacillus laterosporus]
MIIVMKSMMVTFLIIAEFTTYYPNFEWDNTPVKQGNTPSIAVTTSTSTQQKQVEQIIIQHMLSRNIATTDAINISNHILTFSGKYNVDPYIILAMIELESHYQPKAIGKHGDTGLMQILPATQRYMGITGDLTNPEVNIHVGCKYLAYTQNRFGSDLGIVAYNQGEGNIVRGTYKTNYLTKVKKIWLTIKK